MNYLCTLLVKPCTGGGSIRGEIVVIAVAISFILFMLVIYMLMRQYQQKQKTAKIQKLTGLTVFSYRAIKNGTLNFSEKNKLGQGGFGQVYKVCIYRQFGSFGV